MTDFLTTREVAGLMRVKERKVYDLVARSDIPVSRATGKLLFPRDELHSWLARASGMKQAAPATITGSHDPLLEAALRMSGADIATIWNGSSAGLELLQQGRAGAAALHIFAPPDDWNLSLVRQRCEESDVVLISWAKRWRGLVYDSRQTGGALCGLSDLTNEGVRIASRQTGSGAQILFDHLLAEAGVNPGQLCFSTQRHTELDSVLALLEGEAGACFGLQHLASRYRLAFLPLIEERVDLLVRRSFYFEPPFQRLIDYCQSSDFSDVAKTHAGYDISGFGEIRYNSPG